MDRQNEEVRSREECLNRRFDELTQINTASSENQIRLMYQFTGLHFHLEQMGGQYDDLLAELKKQKGLNKMARKEKYAIRKQSVTKDELD